MTALVHTCDTRRDTARRLAREGKSLRAIATQLGVSKDTVRRDLAHGVAPADATDATQAGGVLPGAHPLALEAVEALRDLDAEALRDDVRQLRDTRPYLLATVRRAVELLADTGPLDVLDRLDVSGLADRLCALADAPDTTTAGGQS